MSDYNNRQYNLMGQLLSLFKAGRLPLKDLIGRLDALLAALQDPDALWEKKFRHEWGALEEVYAVALNEQEEGHTADFQTVVAEPGNQTMIQHATENMLRLLSEQRLSTPAS